MLWRVWASQGRPAALSLRHLPEIINKYTAQSASRRAPRSSHEQLSWLAVTRRWSPLLGDGRKITHEAGMDMLCVNAAAILFV